MSTKTAIIHIGTHKTGTTSFQVLMSENWQYFRDQGLYYPVTGRKGPVSRTDRISRAVLGERHNYTRAVYSAHHNLAWEVRGDRRHQPSAGSFAELADELRVEQPPCVLLSSEGFEVLYLRPDALLRIRERFGDIGYACSIVVTLRQPSLYAESLYAIRVRKGFHDDPDAFVEKILADRGYCLSRSTMPVCFDYPKLASAFADVFGDRRVRTLRYDPKDSIQPLLSACGTMSGLTFRSIPDWKRLNTRTAKLKKPKGFTDRVHRLRLLIQNHHERHEPKKLQDFFTSSQKAALDAAFSPGLDDAILRYGRN